MAEISRSSLIETYKNSSSDALGQRDLRFLDVTTAEAASAQANITLTNNQGRILIGQYIEIKHSTNFAQYDVVQVTQVAANVITVASNLNYTYPVGSSVFRVYGERDIVDAAVVSRTEDKSKVYFVEVDWGSTSVD